MTLVKITVEWLNRQSVESEKSELFGVKIQMNNLHFGFYIHSLSDLKGIYSVFQIKCKDATEITFSD